MRTNNALRKALVAATAAGALVILGGCADGTHPGAAAVVGNQEISVGQAEKISAEVSKALGGPFSVQAAVNEQVRADLVAQVAERKSVSISPAEVAVATDEFDKANPGVVPKLQGGGPVAKTFLEDIVRGFAIIARLGGGKSLGDQNAMAAGSEIYLTEAKQIKVVISPRYGQWDPSGRINTTISGSLSAESPQTEAARKAREAKEQAEQQQPQG